MNSIFPGFVFPTLLLVVGILGKKFVVDGFRNWRWWIDLSLGIDFALLGIATCGINFCDLYKLDERLDHATLSSHPKRSIRKRTSPCGMN